jgi:prolyl-tRNA editing enzyme YbaK/EbsC (Cys-tRNA(Pro) deacylase)
MSLPRSARRVQEAVRSLGLPGEVRELDSSARTAAEAASSLGCELGAIVKSLVFRGVSSGSPVVVLVAGDNRADEARLEAVLGEPVERADADFVRSATGYAIGGVPPVGHVAPLRTLVDVGLMRFETVWAAAGTPHAVFPAEPGALARAVGVEPVEVAA